MCAYVSPVFGPSVGVKRKTSRSYLGKNVCGRRSAPPLQSRFSINTSASVWCFPFVISNRHINLSYVQVEKPSTGDFSMRLNPILARRYWFREVDGSYMNRYRKRNLCTSINVSLTIMMTFTSILGFVCTIVCTAQRFNTCSAIMKQWTLYSEMAQTSASNGRMLLYLFWKELFLWISAFEKCL